MRIAALQLELALPGVRSLKEKRGIIKSLLAELRRRFEVAAAEVDRQDVHQGAILGIALVADSAPPLQSRVRKIIEWVERSGRVSLLDHHVEIL
ncbi:MAG: DUF503 domain-containing protein [Magnetococcales bacterium]|nr:DUF503 domain-containing protein [Magnetococcales bacterium]